MTKTINMMLEDMPAPSMFDNDEEGPPTAKIPPMRMIDLVQIPVERPSL